METWRATFWPRAAVRMQPNMTSSTCSGLTPARLRASLTTMAPISAAGVSFREPPKEPMAVRQELTTYTSFMLLDLQNGLILFSVGKKLFALNYKRRKSKKQLKFAILQGNI